MSILGCNVYGLEYQHAVEVSADELVGLWLLGRIKCVKVDRFVIKPLNPKPRWLKYPGICYKLTATSPPASGRVGPPGNLSWSKVQGSISLTMACWLLLWVRGGTISKSKTQTCSYRLDGFPSSGLDLHGVLRFHGLHGELQLHGVLQLHGGLRLL